MCPFVIEDLFAVGLGFDVAGAYLLARGLLATPIQIVTRARSHWDISPVLLVTQARDRVDGLVGLVALVVGFTLQALAYALTLGGLGGGEGDTRRGLVALALSIAAAGLVFIVWKLLGWKLLRKTLIDVACVNYYKKPTEVRSKPYGGTLVMLGEELGHRFAEDESSPAYVRRVWGVDVGDEIDEPQAD